MKNEQNVALVFFFGLLQKMELLILFHYLLIAHPLPPIPQYCLPAYSHNFLFYLSVPITFATSVIVCCKRFALVV